jgi:hypothetical protein
MTFERKIVVGLEDIASISLECANAQCKQRITFSPDTRGRQIPPSCSSCGHVWILHDVTVQFGVPGSLLGIFLQTVERIRAVNSSNPYGVRILLEYKDPD